MGAGGAEVGPAAAVAGRGVAAEVVGDGLPSSVLLGT